MQLANNQHLAYCTNIHPGESWAEIFAYLSSKTLQVRDRLRSSSQSKMQVTSGKREPLVFPVSTPVLSPLAPFAIGLRLGRRAATELLQGDNLDRFLQWLEKEHCYVFTINGFPYGDFHLKPVKEQVYLPDWSSIERLEYSKDLFRILSRLLKQAPLGTEGSVSTLPGSFKGFALNQKKVEMIFEHIHQCRVFIEELSEKEGQDLHLGIEPEPMGLVETSGETLKFFALLVDRFPQDKKLLRYIGVNYDCCHFAVEFEEAAEALERITGAGIRLSKIHLSNAIALKVNEKSIQYLQDFEEGTYLHQVISRKSEQEPLRRYLDLPQALREWEANKEALEGEEWRVHFHVPLHAELVEPLSSTAGHLLETMEYLQKQPEVCQHLEIETYTWQVMPSLVQSADVTEQIEKEYRWALAHLEGLSEVS